MTPNIAKLSLLGLALCGGVASAAPVAQASTATPHYATHIYLNSTDVTNPIHTIATDPSSHQATTFMPIFYAEQVLNKLGITSTWDGKNWSLTVPSNITANLDNPSDGPNQMSIAINGTTVQTAPKVVAVDPASGQQTTFIPVYYLSQVLNRLSVKSTWDGTNWKLTKTTPATKLQTVMDFMNTLRISGDSNGSDPYDDVPTANWPVVHKALEDGYFLADSSSHFGSSDSVTVTNVDHAYQLSLGIPDSHMVWNAGGNLFAWSNAIGLNKGVSVSSALSAGDEHQLMTNIKEINAGYYKDSSGTYHLLFKPYDAWWMSQVPGLSFTSSEISSAMVTAYKNLDATMIQLGSAYNLFHVVGISDKGPNEIVGTSDNSYQQYSTDGGKTWHTPNIWYDSIDNTNGGLVNPPSTVLVRAKGNPEIMAAQIMGKQDVVLLDEIFNVSTKTTSCRTGYAYLDQKLGFIQNGQ